MLRFESLKLMTIIEAETGQNGRKSNAQLFLKHLRYRDSNQIIVEAWFLVIRNKIFFYIFEL